MISQIFSEFESFKKNNRIWRFVLILGIILSFSLLAFYLLQSIYVLAATIVLILISIVSFTLSFSKKHRAVNIQKIKMAFEIDNVSSQNSTSSIFEKDLPPEEQEKLQEDFKNWFEKHRLIFQRKARYLQFSTLCVWILALGSFFSIRNTLAQKLGTIPLFSFLSPSTVFLDVQEGARFPIKLAVLRADQGIPLNRKTSPTIDVVKPNLVRLLIYSKEASKFEILLNPPEKDLSTGSKQAFVVETFFDSQTNKNKAEIQFEVATSSELSIPQVRPSKLASFQLFEGERPKVFLQSSIDTEQIVADDSPIPLNIKVEGSYPIKKVELAIKIGKREVVELVTEVVTGEKKELETTYQLHVDNYLEEPEATVEVIARATDNQDPAPNIGISESIIFNVESSYGKYKRTLQEFKNIKTILDQNLAAKDPKWPADLAKKFEKSVSLAETSTFFDIMDRMELEQMHEILLRGLNDKDNTLLSDMTDKLNKFLFEHETLDDRERDRDFFVAVAQLARQLSSESVTKERKNQSLTHMQDFLKTRQQRWEKRVDNIAGDHKPELWPKIKNQYFEKQIDTLGKNLNAKNDFQKQLNTLSEEYRKWIEQLEASEDKAREKMEQEQSKNLSSLRKDLIEVQRMQSQVSKAVDNANQRTQENLSQAWPVANMTENSAITKAKSLVNKVKQLVPKGIERLEAAIQMMEKTLENGQAGNFVQAESFSDFAVRLLHDTENRAKNQQNKSERGRRRRVVGDQYYGQTVVGGDVKIERQHKVDARYREDILKNIDNDEEGSDLEKNISRRYIEKIIR